MPPEITDPNTDGNLDENTGDGDTSGGNPGTTDWEAAYKGLQKTLATSQTQVETLKGERDTAITELTQLKTRATEFETGNADLTTQVETLTTQVTDLTGLSDNSAAALERSKLIISDYPDLATFEADGLLPTADDMDALKVKLDAFKEKVSKTVQSGVSETLSGATLPDGDDSDGSEDDLSKLNADQLYDRMMQTDDSAELSRLQNLYDAITE
jgi:hypothetical protein